MSKERESERPPPERWSAKAKSEVVLRLFRGESVDAVSREIQVSVHEIETWRKDFLDGKTFADDELVIAPGLVSPINYERRYYAAA